MVAGLCEMDVEGKLEMFQAPGVLTLLEGFVIVQTYVSYYSLV